MLSTQFLCDRTTRLAFTLVPLLPLPSSARAQLLPPTGEVAIACGQELPTGPLIAVESINDRGVLGGVDETGRAALWDPRTNVSKRLGSISDVSASLPLQTSQVLDLNNRGQAVGAAAVPGSYHAFFWSERTGMVDLGTLGGAWSLAYAINDYGHAVGYATDKNEAIYPVLWTSTKSIVRLPLPPGTKNGIARGINRHGQVIGVASGPVLPDNRVITKSFVWSRQEGTIELGSLGGDSTEIGSIDDYGTIMGAATDAQAVSHLFRWKRQTGMVDLGAVGNGHIADSNERGEAIGAFRLPGSDKVRAFVYRPTAGLLDLGIPAPEASSNIFSRAKAINRYGEIVGETNDGNLAVTRPFRWAPCEGGDPELE